MDNVLTVVQGVNWRTLGMELFYDTPLSCSSIHNFNKIEQQHQSDDDRLHAVVNTWVLGRGSDMEPSWRYLIWRLDRINMTGVADTIRHYAEPVLGKSCDSISVSTFLYSV